MDIENQAEREIRELDVFAKELLKNNSDSEFVEKLVKEIFGYPLSLEHSALLRDSS